MVRHTNEASHNRKCYSEVQNEQNQIFIKYAKPLSQLPEQIVSKKC